MREILRLCLTAWLLYSLWRVIKGFVEDCREKGTVSAEWLFSLLGIAIAVWVLLQPLWSD